jgi:PadR family transcriptional regulator PadR
MTTSRDNLIPGTLNLLVLKAVSARPLHGYGITKWILERTEEVLRVEEGVLYPALHRLEKAGSLEAEWGRNDTGRRAKFYTLTPAGAERLRTEVERWRRTSRAVEVVITSGGA